MGVVIAEVQRLLDEAHQGVEKDIAGGANAVSHAEAETLGAWAVLDCARDHAKEAAASHRASKHALEAALAEQAVAELEVKNRSKDVQDSFARHTLAEERRNRVVEAAQFLEDLVLGKSREDAAKDVTQSDPKILATDDVPVDADATARAGA